MKISRELYKTMQDQTAPRSKSWKNIPPGVSDRRTDLHHRRGRHPYSHGILRHGTKNASAWVSIGLVAVSAVCTGLGWYAKLGKHAGAGTLVPITGFANGVVSSAIEARTEGWILGIGTRIFAIAGPVILYGTTASMVYGLLYYFWTLFR